MDLIFNHGWTQRGGAATKQNQPRMTRMDTDGEIADCRSEIRGRQCEPTSSGLKSALRRASGLAVRFGIIFLCMVPAEIASMKSEFLGAGD
jgi:hypothetical protein